MATDARSRTKIYLDSNLTAANLTKDDDSTQVTYIVVYGMPDYPLLKVFRGSKNVDLIFSIGEPDSEPLIGHDRTPYAYKELVPIEIYCIDKSGITGTKLKWKAEAELRSVTENNPLASERSIDRKGDASINLGSTIIYGARYVLNYTRDTST